MFKLKLINKPKMMKLKCNFTFPNIVLANLQEKEVTPTKEIQQIIADQQYDGLSKVTVNAYTAITDKKIITENGTYKASDDNLDGYSEVEVATSGVDINEYFKPTISGNGLMGGWVVSMLKFRSPLTIGNAWGYQLFYNFPLEEVPELLETEKLTNTEYMFEHAEKIKTIPNINTSNVTNMGRMFRYCYELQNIPKLNAEKVTNISDVIYSCSKLETFGGFENLGQAYDTTKSANYSNYKLDLSTSKKLTHDSLMNVINNLYDIKTKGCNPQSLVLGSTNISKLSAEEVAIATNKGFNVN
ncbi:MAG: BspA family leucine-rich repeat surface protein [Candidatus Onthovivens sp.]|nr:BspA family leucine-rich repeat surface protein [Candidatus Onthovivens sp.]